MLLLLMLLLLLLLMLLLLMLLMVRHVEDNKFCTFCIKNIPGNCLEFSSDHMWEKTKKMLLFVHLIYIK